MRSIIGATIVFLLCLPGVGRAQNCCAPAVSPQGVLGETVALPHTLEIGLHYEFLCSRGMYEGSKGIDNPRNTKTDWRRTTLAAAYGVCPQLSISAIIPYTWKKKSLDVAGTGLLEYTSEGIGDISFLFRFSPLGRSFVDFREMSFGLGVKLPTGDADQRSSGLRLIEELQPGTGSTDYLGSVSYYQGFEPVDFFLSATYVLTTAHDDDDYNYEFGNQFSYLLTSNFHLGDRLDLSAALSGVVRGRDRQNGEKIHSTGRHQLWFVPGLQVQVVPEVLRLQVFYEEPVYQHFNGQQLGSEYNIRLTAVYTLPLKKSPEDDT